MEEAFNGSVDVQRSPQKSWPQILNCSLGSGGAPYVFICLGVNWSERVDGFQSESESHQLRLDWPCIGGLRYRRLALTMALAFLRTVGSS
jgi:hypothetical protein